MAGEPERAGGSADAALPAATAPLPFEASEVVANWTAWEAFPR